MPGHPVPEIHAERVLEAVEGVERLFDSHDVVVLATDTRESRWLPTVIGTARNKVRLMLTARD